MAVTFYRFTYNRQIQDQTRLSWGKFCFRQCRIFLGYFGYFSTSIPSSSTKISIFANSSLHCNLYICFLTQSFSSPHFLSSRDHLQHFLLLSVVWYLIYLFTPLECSIFQSFYDKVSYAHTSVFALFLLVTCLTVSCIGLHIFESLYTSMNIDR